MTIKKNVMSLPIGSRIPKSTSGSIFFADVNSKLAQDNSNLFFDNSTKDLTLGSNSTSNIMLKVQSLGQPVLRIQDLDGVNRYSDFRVQAGLLIIQADEGGIGGGALRFDVTGADQGRITISGLIMGGISPLGKIDSATGVGNALVLGADVNATTRTTNTRKFARFGMPHYDLSEQLVNLFTGDSNSTYTRLSFGGGTTSNNAATEIAFVTAPNITTVGGTTKLTIDTLGDVILPIDSQELIFGSGQDSSLQYDGTNFILTTDLISPSDFVVDCGTDKTIKLAETVWDDQQVQLGSVGFGSSAPTKTSYRGSEVLAFNKAQDNKIKFTVQFTHKYKLGTNIEFHLHNTPADDTAGDVKWILTVSGSDIDGDFPVESTFTAIQIIDLNTQHKHILFEIDDNLGTMAGLSGMLLCSLTREGTHVDDDYDNDIYLAGLDAHIELDTIGSRQEAVK